MASARPVKSAREGGKKKGWGGGAVGGCGTAPKSPRDNDVTTPFDTRKTLL